MLGEPAGSVGWRLVRSRHVWGPFWASLQLALFILLVLPVSITERDSQHSTNGEQAMGLNFNVILKIDAALIATGS